MSVDETSGGVFLVKPMRSKNYVTLMDPFQEKYGCTVAAILFIPALLADVLWVACILGVLGKSAIVKGVSNISSNPIIYMSHTKGGMHNKADIL